MGLGISPLLDLPLLVTSLPDRSSKVSQTQAHSLIHFFSDPGYHYYTLIGCVLNSVKGVLWLIIDLVPRPINHGKKEWQTNLLESN